MIVLGIDPGTWVVGFGIVEQLGSQFAARSFGAWRLGSRSVPLNERLHALYTRLSAAIDEFQPDVVALEEAFHGRSAQAALRIGEARGVALLAATAKRALVHQYTPATIKKALTGNGNAAKSQVAMMVTRILGLREVPDPTDASDALAIAVCHLHRSEFARRIT